MKMREPYFRKRRRAFLSRANPYGVAKLSKLGCNKQYMPAQASAAPPQSRERSRLEELESTEARASLIPSLCTRFTRAGIEWRR